jgi:ABC-type lipoprotein release transport system permease subunit
MRFRAELRSHWRAWLTLAVLAGLAGGLVVAAAAGARRTDSALARHLVAYRFPDARVGASDVYDQFRALPQVETTYESLTLAFAARDLENRPVLSIGPRAMAVEVSVDGRDGRSLARWKLLAGRAPDSSRPGEALVDSRAAETLGVEPGDEIGLRVYERGEVANLQGDPETVRGGQLVRLRVVGVKAATDTVDYPGGVVRLTPAFYRAHASNQYTGTRLSIRLRHGAADMPAFRAGGVRITGDPNFRPQPRTTDKIQRSIHLQVHALRLAAAFGAVLAFVLLVQALVRLAAFAALDHPTLRALGMTWRQLFILGLMRAGAIAVAAAALAVGVAAALSPLTPIGLARELEPDPGFAFDSLTVGLGVAAALAVILLTGALIAWRATRPPAEASRLPSAAGSSTADALARRGMPATVVTGVRLALARGRGKTAVPVGATLLGGVLAAAVAVTALTFSASLQHLYSTPRLFGQTWDFEVLYFNRVDRRQVAADARADRSISSLAFGAQDGFSVEVKGGGNWRLLGVRGMDDLKGRLPPTVLEGRAPRRKDEILLGTNALDELGRGVGDTIEVRAFETARMRIVGRGVVANGTTSNPGDGAAMTFEALRVLAPAIPADCCAQVQAKFAPGADREATLARLEDEFVVPVPGLPTTVADFGGVDEMPLVLSALVVAIAAGALAHTLLMSIRRRRRDLAVLKTLGFDRRQVLATVAWQATTFAALGLVVGIPVGIAAGRWTWNLVADELGVVPEPVTPVPLILLVIPAAVLLANLVAAVPARMAARTRPALVLRAE